MDLLASKIVSGEISWQRYFSRPAGFYMGEVGWCVVVVCCRRRYPRAYVWMALRKNSFDRIFYRDLRRSIWTNHVAIVEDANRTALERALPRAGLFPFNRRQFRVCGFFQEISGEVGCAFFSGFNIVDVLGRRDPAFRVHVVNGRLHALRVVF